jgi:hypothetical protein
MKQIQSFTYTIPGSGAIQIPSTNENWYLLASTGAVSVRGDTFGKIGPIVAGQGLQQTPFNRLEVFDESGASNTFTILLCPNEFVNQVFSGSVSLVQSSLDTLRQPLAYTASKHTNGALAANTADTCFLGAANPNGAILLYASCGNREATVNNMGFILKATAPANVFDGDPVLMALPQPNDTGANNFAAQLAIPQFIPAGQGLHFISSAAITATGFGHRSARWKLLP